MILPEAIRLVGGGACPEQYDAFLGDEKVAYLRLRHGEFTVDVGDERVLRVYPKGDGEFDADERGYYLTWAKQIIAMQLNEDAK